MPAAMTKDEVVRIGKERYERDIRAVVESKDKGRFLVLDVVTGQYVVADSDTAAFSEAKSRIPNGVLYIMRIGHPAAFRIGHGSLDASPNAVH